MRDGRFHALNAPGKLELMPHQARMIAAAAEGHRTFLLADEPGRPVHDDQGAQDGVDVEGLIGIGEPVQRLLAAERDAGAPRTASCHRLAQPQRRALRHRLQIDAQVAAANFRGTRTLHRKRAALAGIGFVVGIIALVAGMQLSPVVSVLGFVIMLAATIVALTSWRWRSGWRAAPASCSGRNASGWTVSTSR